MPRLVRLLGLICSVCALASSAAEAVRRTGAVMDDHGTRIGGARVQSFASVSTRDTPEPRGEVVTNADGTFTIQAASDQNATFLIEAAGYVPALVSFDQLAEAASKTVILRRGATLGIRFQGSSLPDSHRVSLIPIDAELPIGLSRQRAIHLWTRSITDGEARWTSLPPGTYQIVVLPVDRPPVEIGEVVLARGVAESVSLSYRSRTGASRQIEVRLGPVDPTSREKASITQWRGGVPARLDLTGNDADPALLTVTTECAAGTLLVAESETYIGSAILDGRCTEAVTIRLEKRSAVSARIQIPAAAAVPTHARFRATHCYAGTAMEIPIAVREGRVRGSVPAGCNTLSVHVDGFAPVRVASRPFQPGASYDLGSVSLHSGAAAVLRVRSGRSGEPLDNVRIACIRTGDAAAMRHRLDPESSAVDTAVTDADGWARMTVPGGERLVFFLHAPGRRLPQISDEYELAAGEETYIDDLRVDPAANVLVTLSIPPSLENAVELHDIELRAAGQNRWPSRVPIRAKVTSSGTRVEDVPPGTYRVFASGRLRNGFALLLGETNIDVAPGIDQMVSLTLTGAVYRGRITQRGLGVQGTINISPADPENRRGSAVAKSNADGEFEVFLERPGEYRVRVQGPGRNSMALGRYVEFDDSGEEVPIELPAGRIRGRVVDSAGNPIAGIVAAAARQGVQPYADVSAITAPNGRFELDGVTSGTWSASAGSDTARSRVSMVAVDQGDVEGITLVAELLQTVTLRVVDSYGAPLRGVEVEFDVPAPGRPVDAPYRRFITPDSGEVKVPLLQSEQTAPVNLILNAADGRLACDVRTLNADQTIAMTPHTGTARLIVRQKGRKQGGRPWLIASSGCAVPFRTHSDWEKTGEPVMVFPRLAAGQWAYVESHSPAELAAVFTGRGLSLPAIATFRVEAGKTTRVPLD